MSAGEREPEKREFDIRRIVVALDASLRSLAALEAAAYLAAQGVAVVIDDANLTPAALEETIDEVAEPARLATMRQSAAAREEFWRHSSTHGLAYAGAKIHWAPAPAVSTKRSGSSSSAWSATAGWARSAPPAISVRCW